MMTDRARLLLVWLLVLAFATALFLSLDLNAHRRNLYLATLTQKPGAGPVSVVFYANRWSRYHGDGSASVTAGDWQVTPQSDSTVLTTRTDDAALTLSSYGAPLYLSLLRISGAGTAILTDGQGHRREIDLDATVESLHSLIIGGDDSAVPAIVGSAFSPLIYYSVYGLIVAAFSLLAVLQLRCATTPLRRPTRRVTPTREFLGFAAPLLLTPLLVQAAFWPASTAYDGGLQWMEAAVPGHLTETIVIPVTLFFRLFARFLGSPAYPILAQIIVAALGVALILRELRARGVPRWAAQLAAVVIAITPQYPAFFATLSKDAWNCAGLLFVVYFALLALRRGDEGHGSKVPIALLGLAGVFSGLMRPNTLPAVLLFMVLMAAWFRQRLGSRVAVALLTLYLAAVVIAPRAALYYSAESEGARAGAAAQGQSPGTRPARDAAPQMPLGVFANIYIFHLFAALVHSEVPIPAQDAEAFFALAPKAAWRDYACANHDQTQLAVERAGLLEPAAVPAYLAPRQTAMAWSVLKLLMRHPAVLMQRQACASQLLWYIGYDTAAFQATVTLGYDSVPASFLAAAGPNHSLIGPAARGLISDYVAWSETWNHRWIFWRPMLYLAPGLFAVLLYSTVRRRYEVLLVAALPVMLTLSLALLIAFPAFRYQYPATLLCMLLFLVAFARPPCTAPGAATAGPDPLAGAPQ